MKLQLSKARRFRSEPIRKGSVLLLSALFLVLGASATQAGIWTRNQVFLNGPSSGTPSVTDDQQASYTGAVYPTAPVHLIYGIADDNGNPGGPTGHNCKVMVNIVLPPNFNVTGLQAFEFAQGAGTGNLLGVNAGSLPNVNIGALATHGDKVIIVIDGSFSQPGNYTADFTPSFMNGGCGGGSETSHLTMDASATVLPTDISLTKQVEPLPSGSYGSTASVQYTNSVRYKLRVANVGATDVYLGGLLKLSDCLTAWGLNDVTLKVTPSNPHYSSSSGNVPWPVLSSSFTTQNLSAWGTYWLPAIQYPTGSLGFLPAGGWFEITFDVLIATNNSCSLKTNELFNDAFFTYSSGTTTISDSNSSNNTAYDTSGNTPATTVNLTGLPTTGCGGSNGGNNCPWLSVTKTVSPSSGSLAWGGTATYTITITNPAPTSACPGTTVTNWGLGDYLYGNGFVPTFTATLVPNSVNANPPTLTVTPATAPVIVGSGSTQLFGATFAPLAPGQTQTITYQAQYAAPCAEFTSNSGAITNWVALNGNAGNLQASCPVTMNQITNICGLQVQKTQTTGPTSFSSFPTSGVTFGYDVKFMNPSSDTITVGTIIDSMAMYNDVANNYFTQYYGDIPIDYSFQCTNNGGITQNGTVIPNNSPLLNGSVTGATMKWNDPLWAGLKLIDISSNPGATFPPGSYLDCNVTATLHQPSTSDSLCQEFGDPHFANSAFMSLHHPYNTNPGNTSPSPTPVWYKEVSTPLPNCLSVVVGKTAPQQVYAGAPVTFTLTVKNTGTGAQTQHSGHTPASTQLIDTLPPCLVGPFSWNHVSGPNATGGFVGNTLTLNLQPIPTGATTTIAVHAFASTTATGSCCNDDNVIFVPGAPPTPPQLPPSTYFEGDQVQLTSGEACIAIAPAPTPTLDKKFVPSVINVGQPFQVVFTITNPPGAPAHTGLGFIDALAGPHFTTGTGSTTCGSGTATVSGINLVLANGSIPAGPSTCTVTFNLAAATACGVWPNTKENIHGVTGLDDSHTNATLTVKCPPTLEKKFDPQVVNMGQPVYVIFTLTNPAGNPAQTNLGFTDNLPNPPFTGGMWVSTGSNMCPGTGSVNGNQVSFSGGQLPAGPSQCQVVFKMNPPTKCGTFHNTQKNIGKIFNLDDSQLSADLTVKCPEVRVGLEKIVENVPANYSGTFNFNVTCTPPGGAPTTSTSWITINAGDPLVPYHNLHAKERTIILGMEPVGTVCSATETGPMPPAPAGCNWDPPTYNPSSGSITASSGGQNVIGVINHYTCGGGTHGGHDNLPNGVAPNPGPTQTQTQTLEGQSGLPVETVCWACVDNRVVQTTVAESRAKNLAYYPSPEEARKHCGEKVVSDTTGEKRCWVCIAGKVSQMPQTLARSRHLQCYGSEEEARAHCKVWCCVDGQVVQVTEDECRARGGLGYSSRTEALKHCHHESSHDNGPRPRATPSRGKGNPRPTPTPER